MKLRLLIAILILAWGAAVLQQREAAQRVDAVLLAWHGEGR